MAQFVANTVLASAFVVLLGLGFGMIYRIAGFFHIAHGAVFTFAAYGLFFLVQRLGLDTLIAAPIAIGAASLLGFAMDRLVHRPLRSQKATAVVHLIASLGLYVAATNLLALCFGDQTLRIGGPQVGRGVAVVGAHLTPVQLTTILLAVAGTVLLVLLEQHTDWGLRYRAVENNAFLARASGVPVDSVLSGSFLAGSAIAGLAGVLLALDVDVRPTMGFAPLLLAVVAVIIGGVGNTRGLLLAAVVIAVLQNTVGWYFGQHWSQPAVFVLLLAFLMFRPLGFFGAVRPEAGEQ